MKTSLTQSLRRAAQLRGCDTALVDGEHHFSWTSVFERVGRLAGAFRTLGLGDGDRVALLAMNSHRSLEVYFAALWAGGIVTPLNHRLAPGEIFAQLTDSAPALLLVGREFAGMGREIAAICPGSRAVISVGEGPSLDGFFAYEDLLTETRPIEDRGRAGDDVACLFYTGGTTGVAKGVMLSHDNILANSVNFITHLGLDDSLVHLHCGPLFHVAAGVRMFSVTQLAARHVMLPRFGAEEVLGAIERHRVTLATFVPTMVRALLDHPEFDRFDLSCLRYITYGAAPMPEALLQEAMTRLPSVRFVQSYGMTETSPIATMLGWRDHKPGDERLRSAGRAALLAEIRIVGPDGAVLDTGQTGEITIKGPMVMRGYWRQPEATARAVRDGWMHTGDIGYLDRDGYLYVIDRLKDVIITGGENVYSQEVENAIAAHPAVQDCAVLGRPDPKWGETVHAVVVPKPGFTLSSEQVQDHCRTLIAGYKCPKSVQIRLSPLPLSGANKILKTELRKELLAAEQEAGR